MALINASSYGNLAAVSVSSNQVQIPIKFFNTFISSDDRGMMESGRYHCPLKFDDNNTKFFVLNEKVVYFIPLYFKKYWAKNVPMPNKDGQMRDRCVAFGWDENSKKVEGAKTEYLIAGWLWDNQQKNIVKHTEDLEENDIKAGDPVLIYFRCKGIKCNCAFNLLKRIDDMIKKLEQEKKISPLSDNPTFERTAINPRRFLIRAEITQSEPIHGRRFKVFDFYPETKLPDELVLKILDASNNKYLDDFNKQFDKTEFVVKAEENTSNTAEYTQTSTPTSNKVESIDIPDVSNNDPNPGDQFQIDI